MLRAFLFYRSYPKRYPKYPKFISLAYPNVFGIKNHCGFYIPSIPNPTQLIPKALLISCSKLIPKLFISVQNITQICSKPRNGTFTESVKNGGLSKLFKTCKSYQQGLCKTFNPTIPIRPADLVYIVIYPPLTGI